MIRIQPIKACFAGYGIMDTKTEKNPSKEFGG